jgi:hypothetical protein
MTMDGFPDDLLRLMAEGPERCTLCRKPFAHHVSIYCGVAKNGAVAIVGNCCVDQMKDVYGVGLTDRRYKEPLDA